jgi:hypothetical protein
MNTFKPALIALSSALNAISQFKKTSVNYIRRNVSDPQRNALIAMK